MNADAGAEKMDSEPGLNPNGGDQAERSVNQSNRAAAEADRNIRMFDRMSRQPTVEDDDSDWGSSAVKKQVRPSVAPSLQRLRPVTEASQRSHPRRTPVIDHTSDFESRRMENSKRQNNRSDTHREPDILSLRLRDRPAAETPILTGRALQSHVRSHESHKGTLVRASGKVRFPKDHTPVRSESSSLTSSDEGGPAKQYDDDEGRWPNNTVKPNRAAWLNESPMDLDQISIKAQQSTTDASSDAESRGSSELTTFKQPRTRLKIDTTSSPSHSDLSLNSLSGDEKDNAIPKRRAKHHSNFDYQPNEDSERDVSSEIEEYTDIEEESSWSLIEDESQNRPSHLNRVDRKDGLDAVKGGHLQHLSGDSSHTLPNKSRPTELPGSSAGSSSSRPVAHVHRPYVPGRRRHVSISKSDNKVFKFAPPLSASSTTGSSSPSRPARRPIRPSAPGYASSMISESYSPAYRPPSPPQTAPGHVNYYNTPYPGYVNQPPNPLYPFSNLEPYSYGQPFYLPPAPRPPPAPLPPGYPVARELRALLAPPAPDPPPPIAPEVPASELYDSDDDPRTVVAEPHITHAYLRGSGVRASSTDNSTDFDTEHLEQLRFEVDIPLHLWPTTLKTWPEISSVEHEPGPAHSYRRHKALKAHRLNRGDETWQSIELQCRKGPSPSSLSQDAEVDWLHMQSESMDLVVLEDHCLSAPDITSELQYVVARLFEKIRKAHRQQFFDGFLLTPGTVLRWDGRASGYNSAQSLTATFVCFPFLTLQPHGSRLETRGKTYPSRSVLQTLYPFDSTFKQDLPPSFSAIAPNASDKVLLVPQIWCVSIGHRYVITYSQLTSAEVCGTTVKVTSHLSDSISPDEEWQSVSHQKPSTSSEVAGDTILFDGKRVEDFRVFDFTASSENKDFAITNSPKANTWHSVSCAVAGSSTINSPIPAKTTTDRPSSSGAVRGRHGLRSRWRSAEPIRDITGNTQVPFNTQPAAPDQTFVDELKPTAALLSALDSPEFTMDYVETFKTCLTSITKRWPRVIKGPCDKELQQLWQSVQTADQLRKILDLEDKNTELAAHNEYRATLIRVFGLRSIAQEVAHLGQTVDVVYRLLREYGTREAHIAFQIRRPEESTRSQRNPDDLRDIAERSFLAWPWISSSMGVLASPTKEAAHRLSDNLRRILQDSDDRIQHRDDKSYSAASSSTLIDLQALLASFRSSHSVYSDEIPPVTSEEPQAQEPGANPHIGPSANASQPISRQRRRQLTTSAIETLVQASTDLIAKFIPCVFPHRVLGKIWGSLEATSQKPELTKIQLMMDNLDPDKWLLPLAYVVRQPGEGTLPQDLAAALSFPLDACRICSSGFIYRSRSDALAHLKGAHFPNTRNRVLEDHLREHWIQTATEVRLDLVNTHHLRLAKLSTEYLSMLTARAESIHDRTQSRQDGDERYVLPGGLVDCFETIAMFIIQIKTIMFGTQMEIRYRTELPTLETELQMGTYALSRLGHLGKAAEQAMTRAEKALVLSDATTTVELKSAGPELLITVLLQNVQRRALVPGDDQGNYALYHNYASRLRYQISRFPRRRLLQDIHVFQEELDVVRRVNTWQEQCFEDLMLVIDPRSFAKPTDDRIAMFPAERVSLQQMLDLLQVESEELGALWERVQYLRNQLRQSVEILEEDHGKAIFVFTMVTTIFLPLSFVSSFFGMNFADIRDMERTQGLFWACAVPVTAGIIIIAVSLANHGDKVLETLNYLWQRFKYREQESTLVTVAGDEKSYWNSSTTGLPQTQVTHRRRRTVWGK